MSRGDGWGSTPGDRAREQAARDQVWARRREEAAAAARKSSGGGGGGSSGSSGCPLSVAGFFGALALAVFRLKGWTS